MTSDDDLVKSSTNIQITNNGVEDDEVYTMEDIVQGEKNLCDTANAVLGESEASCCTYPKGYIRQAVFVCITCTPCDYRAPTKEDKHLGTSDSLVAGICFGCSVNCHQGHEIIELYTKRHFQCDCGNSKFKKSKTTCSLFDGKIVENAENKYNQNFQGLYCRCSRPYPDPERTSEEILLQCIICEDWYHEEHLGLNFNTATELNGNDFDEAICGNCMVRNEFLYHYQQHETPENENDVKDLCLLKKFSGGKPVKMNIIGLPTFWDASWRIKLCKCEDCLKMYAEENIKFLIDVNDTLMAYEQNGLKKRLESGDVVEEGTKAFTKSFSHVQQVEMANSYRDLSVNLKGYLKGFADENKVVKAEDIKSFFETLNERKRQKVSK